MIFIEKYRVKTSKPSLLLLKKETFKTHLFVYVLNKFVFQNFQNILMKKKRNVRNTFLE
jgi:hypothetical protein